MGNSKWYLANLTCRQTGEKRHLLWGIYHKLEEKQKNRFLKKLSICGGFKILSELNQFANKLSTKPNFKKLDADKIKTLNAVHSIFGKVK